MLLNNLMDEDEIIVINFVNFLQNIIQIQNKLSIVVDVAFVVAVVVYSWVDDIFQINGQYSNVLDLSKFSFLY